MTTCHFVLEYFNSHPHKEDDFSFLFQRSKRLISTHILTRRMTYHRQILQQPYCNFNSHPHKEDDVRAQLCHRYYQYFNSHPHKEDDQPGITESLKQTDFNSHPHKEDDCLVPKESPIFFISTHILTRRMTV